MLPLFVPLGGHGQLWRGLNVLKGQDPLGQHRNIPIAPVQMPGEGTPEARIVVVGERRQAVTCGVGGRLRVDVGESSLTRLRLPQEGGLSHRQESGCQREMRSSFRLGDNPGAGASREGKV